MERVIDRKVIRIGYSLGVIIPKQTAEKLNIKSGDIVSVNLEMI